MPTTTVFLYRQLRVDSYHKFLKPMKNHCISGFRPLAFKLAIVLSKNECIMITRLPVNLKLSLKGILKDISMTLIQFNAIYGIGRKHFTHYE